MPDPGVAIYVVLDERNFMLAEQTYQCALGVVRHAVAEWIVVIRRERQRVERDAVARVRGYLQRLQSQ